MRKGKVGKPRGPKACYTMSPTSLEFCLPCPVYLARKVTMFEPPRKKRQKLREKSQKCTFEQSAHWFVALGSAISGNQAQGNDLGQTALVQEWPNNCEKPTENATKLTAHSSHHCPKSSKMPQKHGKNDKFMIKISKNTTKTRQKRQFDVQN